MSSIKKKDLKYNLHSWSAQGKLDPIVITKAEGIYFWDEEGKRYADMSSIKLPRHFQATKKRITSIRFTHALSPILPECVNTQQNQTLPILTQVAFALR